jgi:hypothetical protein
MLDAYTIICIIEINKHLYEKLFKSRKKIRSELEILLEKR